MPNELLILQEDKTDFWVNFLFKKNIDFLTGVVIDPAICDPCKSFYLYSSPFSPPSCGESTVWAW